jgi:RNA polymerase sigma-70 factor (ECF subfamily)
MDLEPSVVARLRHGDVAALEICYRRFGPQLQRLCLRLLGRDRADDAVQEIFVQVLERADQFDGRSRFSTWLYRVSVNHCLKQLRREHRRATLPLSDSITSGWAEDDSRAFEAREQVERWLTQLDPAQRAVLVLRELQGLDYQHIAELLEVPLGTVMSRLHRARQKLIAWERGKPTPAPRQGVKPR